MKISICGDIGDECLRYKATVANDTARMEQLTEEQLLTAIHETVKNKMGN